MNVILRQIIIVVLLIVVVSTSVCFKTTEAMESSVVTVLEGRVPSIKMAELYLDNKKFYIDNNVKVFQNQDGGESLSIKVLANMGWIDKARIYLVGGTVVKIVVLSVVQ